MVASAEQWAKAIKDMARAGVSMAEFIERVKRANAGIEAWRDKSLYMRGDPPKE